MATPMRTSPVEDSVPRVGNELAVGEDLVFQQKWWRFERAVWIAFVVLVLLDLAGVFGRGPVANKHIATPDKAMDVRYERVERFRTPSIITIHFSPGAVHNGKIVLWVSDSIIKELGNQRVVPQPAESSLDAGGIRYTFTASQQPNSAEFALEPSSPGLYEFTLRLPELPQDELHAKVAVMP